MNWFGNKAPYEPESDPPTPPRTASDEYLAGLKFVADIYESRGRNAERVMKERATEISNSTNLERIGSNADEIKRLGSEARTALGIAEEIRQWSGDFEFRGYRPPHLPPLPPDNTPHESGE